MPILIYLIDIINFLNPRIANQVDVENLLTSLTSIPGATNQVFPSISFFFFFACLTIFHTNIRTQGSVAKSSIDVIFF